MKSRKISYVCPRCKGTGGVDDLDDPLELEVMALGRARNTIYREMMGLRAQLENEIYGREQDRKTMIILLRGLATGTGSRGKRLSRELMMEAAQQSLDMLLGRDHRPSNSSDHNQ